MHFIQWSTDKEDARILLHIPMPAVLIQDALIQWSTDTEDARILLHIPMPSVLIQDVLDSMVN